MTEHRKADLKGRDYFNLDFPTQFITAGTNDDYNKLDMYLTARTDTSRIYAVEIKNINRTYGKYNRYGIDYGFQIDLYKIDALWEKWITEGRIPILYVRFSDWTYAWDIRNIDYQSRAREVKTNDDGQNYGASKSVSWQTYFYMNEAVWSKKTNNN